MTEAVLKLVSKYIKKYRKSIKVNPFTFTTK